MTLSERLMVCIACRKPLSTRPSWPLMEMIHAECDLRLYANRGVSSDPLAQDWSSAKWRVSGPIVVSKEADPTTCKACGGRGGWHKSDCIK